MCQNLILKNYIIERENSKSICKKCNGLHINSVLLDDLWCVENEIALLNRPRKCDCQAKQCLFMYSFYLQTIPESYFHYITVVQSPSSGLNNDFSLLCEEPFYDQVIEPADNRMFKYTRLCLYFLMVQDVRACSNYVWLTRTIIFFYSQLVLSIGYNQAMIKEWAVKCDADKKKVHIAYTM